MKQFHVTLGGQERRLRFTSSDAKTVRRRLNTTFVPAVRAAIAMDADGKAHPEQGLDFEALVVLLALGLGHDDVAVTEEKAGELLDAFIAEGGNAWKVGEVIGLAAFYAGLMTGSSVDIDARVEELGKETPPTAETPPTEAVVPAVS